VTGEAASTGGTGSKDHAGSSSDAGQNSDAGSSSDTASDGEAGADGEARTDGEAGADGGARVRHGPEPGRRQFPGRHPVARSGFIEYDRIVFFSDAVFAIAITLLAVNLRVPDSGHTLTWHDLHLAFPEIRGFWISFAVIALFWTGHHWVFRYIVAFDRMLITLNLVLLGTVAFLPYPTDLLSESTGGRQSTAVIFYAACVAVAGLAETAVWLYATRSPAHLTDPSTIEVRTFYLLRIARVPAVFLVSIPIAIFSPDLATWSWLLLWVTGVLINRFASPRLRADEKGQEAGLRQSG
jgi:uncharacterized membrane protein